MISAADGGKLARVRYVPKSVQFRDQREESGGCVPGAGDEYELGFNHCSGGVREGRLDGCYGRAPDTRKNLNKYANYSDIKTCKVGDLTSM